MLFVRPWPKKSASHILIMIIWLVSYIQLPKPSWGIKLSTTELYPPILNLPFNKKEVKSTSFRVMKTQTRISAHDLTVSCMILSRAFASLPYQQNWRVKEGSSVDSKE